MRQPSRRLTTEPSADPPVEQTGACAPADCLAHVRALADKLAAENRAKSVQQKQAEDDTAERSSRRAWTDLAASMQVLDAGPRTPGDLTRLRRLRHSPMPDVPQRATVLLAQGAQRAPRPRGAGRPRARRASRSTTGSGASGDDLPGEPEPHLARRGALA